MIKKEKKKVLLGMLIASLFLTSCGLIPKEEKFEMAPIVQEYEGTAYSKVSVKKGDVVLSQSIPCTYASAEEERMSFEQSDSIVEKVYVKVGDKVEEGDIIVQLKSEELDSQIEGFDFEIKKSEIIIRQTEEMKELEIAKQKKVYNDKNAISAIENNYNANINALKDALKIIKMNQKDVVDQKNDYALFAGKSGKIVFLKEALEGSTTVKDENICIISQKATPYFAAETEFANQFVDGQEVNVSVSNELYVTTVSHPEENKNMVQFNIDTGIFGLSTGKSANAILVKDQRLDVLFLPEVAVKAMGETHVVYYEDEKGIKAFKEVQVGLTADNKTEIVSGLELGEAVIVQ